MRILFFLLAFTLVADQAPRARGANFLLSTQAEDGSWSAHPAITALCILAIHDVEGVKSKAAIEKGLTYVLSFRQPDGAVYPANRDMKSSANYPNYTTATTLLMLGALNRREHHDIMRGLRKFLQDSQFDEPGKIDYGGIGYGKTGRADLSNATWAAEALAATDFLDHEQAKVPHLRYRFTYHVSVHQLRRHQGHTERDAQNRRSAEFLNRRPTHTNR